jgi:hypothetical protein
MTGPIRPACSHRDEVVGDLIKIKRALPERNLRSCVIHESDGECVVDLKAKFRSPKTLEEVCLGVTVTGIETLVGLSIILLMRY